MPENENENENEKYHFVAHEYYKNEREQQKSAMALQGDYGKWLVNSLMLIHGGALVGLAQSSAFGKGALLHAGLWFVGGLISALGCGFFSWLNWSWLAHKHADWAKPAMVFDASQWPKSESGWFNWITITYWLAIMFGLASAALIVCGAVAATSIATPM